MRKEKKRRGKRWLASVLAAALVFGAVSAGPPVSVKAAETEEGTGTGGDVGKIPDGVIVEGTVITSAKNFVGTELDLSNTNITRISDRAFSGKENLTTVILPATLESIGDGAFYRCSALNKVFFEENSKLKSMEYQAFYDCVSLTEFSLPDSVESIGGSAFAGCSSLEQFTIGKNSSLKTIGNIAFSGCALTGRICFPASLNNVDSSAFWVNGGHGMKLRAVEFKNKDTQLGSSVFPHSDNWDENVVFYSEPGGLVEKYARDNGFRFQRPASSFTVETADGEPLDFFYGDTINAAVLQLKGVTASAEFNTDPGVQGDVKLSDCLLSGFNTKEVGKQEIRFDYYDNLKSSIPINVYYDMSTARVSTIYSQTYTGSEIKPGFTVTLKAGTDLTLEEGTDYTVEWKDNVNVGTATGTLTGKGFYKGTKEVTFNIQEQSIGSVMDVRVESETVEYTGKAVEPEVTVTLGSKTLVKGSDYTLTYTDNIEPGTAKVTVTCKGNYSGSVTKNFKIIRDISKDMEITIKKAGSLEYTGEMIKPEILVMLDGEVLDSYYDYTVSYKNNILPGENTASVTVTGKGLYSGSQEMKFTIRPKDIQDTMTVNLAQTSVTYTGTEQKPKVTVYDSDSYYANVLEEGTDYILTYADNTEAGTATVTVTCTGLYAGEAVKEFTITPLDISEKAEVSLEAEEMAYTGEALEPETAVTFGRNELVKDSDFKVQYKNNIQAGTAEVVVTGKGNYSGTVTKTFRIFYDINGEMKVAFVEDELEFTGKPIAPSFTVAWNGTVLMPQEDFDVSYQNNTNVGLAQVKVTCKGKYRGEVVASFTITKRDITDDMDCVLSYDEAVATGKALTPSVTVRLGNRTLVMDEDYTVKYADNVNPGIATVTVTAKGNYEGTAVLSFTILKPASPEPTETAKPTASPEPTETAKPTASPEPDETAKPTASPAASETEKPTASPAASEPGTSQPGVSQPGTSQPETPTAPPAADDADNNDSDDGNEVKSEKVKNLKAKNDKKKSLTLTWKNVRNAKSYQIQYSTSKKFKGSKTKVSNKAKATLKGLKKKKTYYIRVRACTVSDGKKVYGAWSAVQKVKIKK